MNVRYTQEQKANALKRLNEIGLMKASRELHISSQTLRSWQKAAAGGRKPDTVSAEAAAIMREQYAAVVRELKQVREEKDALQARLDRAVAALNAALAE